MPKNLAAALDEGIVAAADGLDVPFQNLLTQPRAGCGGRPADSSA